jgi:diguanylate cyclase (GGDEF)-like protein
MRRLRYLFLLLVTLGFAAGIIASLINNGRSAQLTASRIQLSAWSLAQLEHEFIRFHTSLRLFQAGALPAARLQLDYDLLWNRLEVFLNGDENKAIRQRFGAEKIAQELFAQLQQDETLLFAPDLQPGPPLAERLERYSHYQQPIRKLIVHNFTGPEAAGIVDELHEYQGLTQALLLGLLFCGGGLLLMLFFESRRNNFLARNDSLTGLPSRQSLLALQNRSNSAQHYSAIAVIEMSNFRAVNEHISHEAGDQLLSRIGSILNQLKPKGSFIARVGGDEFIVTFSQVFPPELVIETLKALAQALHFDFQSDKQLFQVSARIGVVLNGDKALDIEKLYYCATLAVRELRMTHDQGIQIFDEEINSRYLRSRHLLSDLKQAIAGKFPGLSLHYQPILGLKQPALGVEALLRWMHPRLGPISPLEVVELAENNQLGLQLGHWILQRLKQDLHRLPGKIREQLYFSVNLSPSQFTPRLPASLSQWLADAPIAAHQLLLEMTESISVVNFADSQSILESVNALGIDTALDDFGTGYSSLSYLSSLKVQRIKIDKSFIQGISTDLQLQRVVRSIIELCHIFNFSVICEGIEDSADDQQVRALGSDYAQGYYYGKPMALEALIAWYGSHHDPARVRRQVPEGPISQLRH